MKKTFKTFARHFYVPIYGVNVFVIVSDDIAKERDSKKWVDIFGEFPDAGEYWALCARAGNKFGVFFTPKCLTSKVVAHEVFHLTHRIMEWTGEPFDSTKHEQGAALHEYLWERVNAALTARTTGKQAKKATNAQR